MAKASYYEGRPESCWACKYFIQTDPANPYGVCVRRAPDKSDQKNTSSVYPNLEMFQSLTDAAVTFCGDFAQMEGEVPPVPED